MDYNKLAELLFPKVNETPADMEIKYPPRDLPEGAKVTRFAPSPTGFVHFGGLLPTTTGERLAHQSGGIFILRIEDTDAKREVPGAAEALILTLAKYGIHFDEGAALDENGNIVDNGNYGPYKQSLRGPIYHVYAKDLVRRGLAYPCFSTVEELDELNAKDKKAEIKEKKEWDEQAWLAEEAARKEQKMRERSITLEEVVAHLEAGEPFVLRLLADGDPSKKTKFTDLVKGTLEIPENDEDFVLLKSDGIPTYHFAHAVDDHLMGTTHVIRGEEWLPSVAKHIQLFRYLGFKLPKYMHNAQIMRLDENGNRKKLSKRDMGANLSDYSRLGYAPECVCEYIMTLLNSNYEEWHMQNPDKAYTEFPFNIKKMSASGCLFDLAKLGDVSKNVISRMTADKVYEGLLCWAEDFDKDYAEKLKADPDYAKAIISIGRGGKKPRKDYGTYVELKEYTKLFYDDSFEITDDYPETADRCDIKKALSAFLETYDPEDDQNTWFDKIKAVAESLGYASDMKAYKAAPSQFRGSVADISMFIRVAVTGKLNSPDMFTVMNILGADRVRTRINSMINKL